MIGSFYKSKDDPPHTNPRREYIHEVIFGTDTLLGRLFDIVLLVGIVLSVAAVMLESVSSISNEYSTQLRAIEWVFTGVFTIEYGLRVFAAHRPLRYVFSFFGIIDLVSILPTFMGLYFDGAHSLLVIRALRLLRIFRILKLTRYVGESNALLEALVAARAKIAVFFWAIVSIMMILGTLMYLIEGGDNGFTSIPRSIYWAIVTMTTVGYGDITPQTTFGQFVAAGMMILGYAILAVPTGIVSAELANPSKNRSQNEQATNQKGRREDNKKESKKSEKPGERQPKTCPHCKAKIN